LAQVKNVNTERRTPINTGERCKNRKYVRSKQGATTRQNKL
jgi:hypothetical protein